MKQRIKTALFYGLCMGIGFAVYESLTSKVTGFGEALSVGVAYFIIGSILWFIIESIRLKLQRRN